MKYHITTILSIACITIAAGEPLPNEIPLKTITLESQPTKTHRGVKLDLELDQQGGRITKMNIRVGNDNYPIPEEILESLHGLGNINTQATTFAENKPMPGKTQPTTSVILVPRKTKNDERFRIWITPEHKFQLALLTREKGGGTVAILHDIKLPPRVY